MGREKDKRVSPLSKKIVIILSLVVLAFVATGYVRARSNDEKAYRALTVYSEVLDKVQNDYVDDPNIGQGVEPVHALHMRIGRGVGGHGKESGRPGCFRFVEVPIWGGGVRRQAE